MIFGFIVLLRSLASVADLTKCLFLNDKSCIIRPTIIDMNPVELKCYPFMISLKKTLISKISTRLLGWEFKSDNILKSKATKAIVEKTFPDYNE